MKSISNSVITNVQPTAFYFDESECESFKNNVLNGIHSGVRVFMNSNVTITNSTFNNLHQEINANGTIISDVVTPGSALGKLINCLSIEIIDSNVVVQNSTFFNNTSMRGGAISIS